MANYTHVGTLKKGRHYVLDFDKWFEAGDLVPLTESGATNSFADKFRNIRKAKAAELKAFAAES